MEDDDENHESEMFVLVEGWAQCQMIMGSMETTARTMCGFLRDMSERTDLPHISSDLWSSAYDLPSKVSAIGHLYDKISTAEEYDTHVDAVRELDTRLSTFHVTDDEKEKYASCADAAQGFLNCLQIITQDWINKIDTNRITETMPAAFEPTIRSLLTSLPKHTSATYQKKLKRSLEKQPNLLKLVNALGTTMEVLMDDIEARVDGAALC